ncbi:dienelactone hydrolase family protein [Methylocapsa acidiphila]|uniref:dienelactone hydrolase family protein n=1 Tax=Methylocapsa acidiphila TaxID=133552 RepID=UPI0004190A58|nr:dienelactone hydrolase family protein [Methylocapsa acidiphila]
MSTRLRLLFLFTLVVAVAPFDPARSTDNPPKPVSFPSLDGKTQLVGYVFMPETAARSPRPAIVMMHGRAGPYSSTANGVYDASTLSRRHAAWGRFWADQGFVVLLVDSFGPRSYPEGFPIHSYKDRPEAVNEVTVRPLDAYGALVYLRQQAFVDPKRIALQGWSNGGSAALAAMSDATLAENQPAAQAGFAGAVAFYPACALHERFDGTYRPYAPVRVFSGDNDEEVSAERCVGLVENSARRGGDIGIEVFSGATHGFDDPSEKRQRIVANREAAHDAVEETLRFVRKLLSP